MMATTFVVLLGGENYRAKFKVDQLKEICDTFGVVIEGPVGRKKSYITPIEALVKTCSCSK